MLAVRIEIDRHTLHLSVDPQQHDVSADWPWAQCSLDTHGQALRSERWQRALEALARHIPRPPRI